MKNTTTVNDTVQLTFGSLDELRARPAFRDNVAVSGVKPYKILGSYRFQQPVACGVQGCTQTHIHGYLLMMPDGVETNAGWDCGLDHFGVGFPSMRKEYDRLEREQPYRARARLLAADAAAIRERLHILQSQRHGGEWLLQNLRQFAKLYPREMLQILQRHAPRGELPIVEAPSRPVENFETSLNRALDANVAPARPVTGVRGTLRGLAIFAMDTNSWPLFELEIELNEFAGAYSEDMAFVQVLRWCEWADALELRLQEFQHMLVEGKRFFTRGNLVLLPYAVEDPKLRDRLAWIVWSKDAVNDRVRQSSTGKAPTKPGSLQRMFKRFLAPHS